MAKIIALGALVALIACANHRVVRTETLQEKGDPAHPLYVGHSDIGEVVVAASHYDAMQGLAVTAADIGQPGAEQLYCKREMLTGTHVPKWVCRDEKDMAQERMLTQDYLDTPRLSLGRGAPGSSLSGPAAPQAAPIPH